MRPYAAMEEAPAASQGLGVSFSGDAGDVRDEPLHIRLQKEHKLLMAEKGVCNTDDDNERDPDKEWLNEDHPSSSDSDATIEREMKRQSERRIEKERMEMLNLGSRRYEHVHIDNRDPIEAHPDIPHEWYQVQREKKAENIQNMIMDKKGSDSD